MASHFERIPSAITPVIKTIVKEQIRKERKKMLLDIKAMVSFGPESVNAVIHSEPADRNRHNVRPFTEADEGATRSDKWEKNNGLLPVRLPLSSKNNLIAMQDHLEADRYGKVRLLYINFLLNVVNVSNGRKHNCLCQFLS